MEKQTHKKEIRKQMISRRDALSEAERIEFSRCISKRLFAMNEYKNAGTVLSYASFRSEVITDEINEQVLADGKELYLPKTFFKEKRMAFYRVSDLKNDLAEGAMGISEPIDGLDEFHIMHGSMDKHESLEDYVQEDTKASEDVIEHGEILILMPGVAYDKAGNRMGYGGGFYDRFLAENDRLKDQTILIAFRAQEIENLPVEETDFKPKLILTEEGIV